MWLRKRLLSFAKTAKRASAVLSVRACVAAITYKFNCLTALVVYVWFGCAHICICVVLPQPIAFIYICALWGQSSHIKQPYVEWNFGHLVGCIFSLHSFPPIFFVCVSIQNINIARHGDDDDTIWKPNILKHSFVCLFERSISGCCMLNTCRRVAVCVCSCCYYRAVKHISRARASHTMLVDCARAMWASQMFSR